MLNKSVIQCSTKLSQITQKQNETVNEYISRAMLILLELTFSVGVKTLIIGDCHEGCKKGRQDNWLFNKKLSSAIPCNDIIALKGNFW